MPNQETLGKALRDLREGRGVGIRELARRAGTSKRSVQDWETDRYLPSGPALDRLLKALETPPRTRARLLALAAPTHARLVLADTPLGPPVDAGEVLRAMRRRGGATQGEIARRIGVSQATLARWESGDSTPSTERLHDLLFALDASVEEALALMSVKTREAASGGLEDTERRIRTAADLPLPLRNAVLLGIESELWWHATRDAAAKPLLCDAIATRAHHALMAGLLEEVPELVRRAKRLTRATGYATPATAAVYAMAWTQQRTPGRADSAVRLLGNWSERVEAPRMRLWLQSAHALATVRAGEPDQGIGILERIERAMRDDEWGAGGYFLEDLIRAHLIAGRPERAEDLLERTGGMEEAATRAMVALARGNEPTPETLRAAYGHARAWPAIQEMRQIENAIRHVRQGKRAHFS
jgi:transcriptional regulator with XRE-family HTH domain